MAMDRALVVIGSTLLPLSGNGSDVIMIPGTSDPTYLEISMDMNVGWAMVIL
jgi:hypothetical protein